jgi:gliding motility-associated lipoprotein GldH
MAKFYIVGLLLLFACSEPGQLVQDYQSIDDEVWTNKQTLTFPVEVADHTKAHRLFYLVRYNKDYPYYNFYVKRHLLDSTGKELSSTLQGMYLFDEKTGEPKGGGWGNNYDYSILADSIYRFPYDGKYTIAIDQYMRKDSIPGISDFGLSISTHE